MAFELEVDAGPRAPRIFGQPVLQGEAFVEREREDRPVGSCADGSCPTKMLGDFSCSVLSFEGECDRLADQDALSGCQFQCPRLGSGQAQVWGAEEANGLQQRGTKDEFTDQPKRKEVLETGLPRVVRAQWVELGHHMDRVDQVGGRMLPLDADRGPCAVVREDEPPIRVEVIRAVGERG